MFELPCVKGQLSIVKCMWKHIPLSLFDKHQHRDQFLNFVISRTCVYEHVNVVKFLYEVVSPQLRIPIQLNVPFETITQLCKDGHFETLKYMIEKMECPIYDLNQKTEKDGHRGFHYACEYRHTNIIEYLCDVVPQYSVEFQFKKDGKTKCIPKVNHLECEANRNVLHIVYRNNKKFPCWKCRKYDGDLFGVTWYRSRWTDIALIRCKKCAQLEHLRSYVKKFD